MAHIDPLRAATEALGAEELLRFLIQERFPGKSVVTASLRAPSVVVLAMVAAIDPATPVVFCRRGATFPESTAYHDTIVGLLGLTDVRVTAGHEPVPRRGDYDHCEQMRVEYANCPGSCHEVAHLNDILAPYECWVSAVYHVNRPAESRVRIDAEGRLCRVNPLAGWSDERIREFMQRHGLPHHERAYRGRMPRIHQEDWAPVETFNV